MSQCGCRGVCGGCRVANPPIPPTPKYTHAGPDELEEYVDVEGVGDWLTDALLISADPSNTIDVLRDRFVDPGPEANRLFQESLETVRELEPKIRALPDYPNKKADLERLEELKRVQQEWTAGRKDLSKLNAAVNLVNAIRKDFKLPPTVAVDPALRDVLTRTADDLTPEGPADKQGLDLSTKLIIGAGLLAMGAGFLLGRR